MLPHSYLIYPSFVFVVLLALLRKVRRSPDYILELLFTLFVFIGYYLSPLLWYFSNKIPDYSNVFFYPEYVPNIMFYVLCSLLSFLMGIACIKHKPVTAWKEYHDKFKALFEKILNNSLIPLIVLVFSFVLFLVLVHANGGVSYFWEGTTRGDHFGINQYDRKELFFLNIFLTLQTMFLMIASPVTAFYLAFAPMKNRLIILPVFLFIFIIACSGQSRLCGLSLIYLGLCLLVKRQWTHRLASVVLLLVGIYISFACYFLRGEWGQQGLKFFFYIIADFGDMLYSLDLSSFNMLSCIHYSTSSFYIHDIENFSFWDQFHNLLRILSPLPGMGYYEFGVNSISAYFGVYSFGVPNPTISQTYTAFGNAGIFFWFFWGLLVGYIENNIFKYLRLESISSILILILCVFSFVMMLHSGLRASGRFLTTALLLCILQCFFQKYSKCSPNETSAI